jgi:hypothetical protein
MRYFILIVFLSTLFTSYSQNNADKQTPYIIIVQPIVVQSDEGTDPASMALPEELVDKAFEKAEVDFHFLEPVFYNSTRARDGLINLDEIVKLSYENGLIKGQGDIVNMFFVNSVDGIKGPLGRGMMGGNITFIALGDSSDKNNKELEAMQAFVIAHEVGHNLSLKHAVDDPNVPDSIPNIQGDGDFEDRINPKYSLVDYQINLILKSQLVHPRIEFLSMSESSKAILDESFEPYFSQLQIREIEAFTNKELITSDIIEARNSARERFASAVIDFTDDEKQCISYVVNEITTVMLDNDIQLLAEHPWRFIKIEDWLCGGFAHTRGTFIILSQRHINHLSKDWKSDMTDDEKQNLILKFGSMLVHEQMHSLQRTYPSRFLSLYTEYWNFVHADVETEEKIQKDQVSNPDAPIAEWLIPNNQNNSSYYWVRTLLKTTENIPVMGKDFTNKVFVVERFDNKYVVKKDMNDEIITSTMDDIKFYVDSYPPNRGIDHPNEISAYMFAEYFSDLVSEKMPFENIPEKAEANTLSFQKWIDFEMK